MSTEMSRRTKTSSKGTSSKKGKGRSRKRPLRGSKLVRAVRREMSAMVNLSPKNKEDRINVWNLAHRLKISRMAIYDNGLEQEVKDFAGLQRSNDKVNTEAAALRRPLEVRIKELEKKVKELVKQIDGYIQRWITVEHNAKMHGYDPDRLFAPVPPSLRKTLPFKSRKKKR